MWKFVMLWANCPILMQKDERKSQENALIDSSMHQSVNRRDEV